MHNCESCQHRQDAILFKLKAMEFLLDKIKAEADLVVANIKADIANAEPKIALHYGLDLFTRCNSDLVSLNEMLGIYGIKLDDAMRKEPGK